MFEATANADTYGRYTQKDTNANENADKDTYAESYSKEEKIWIPNTQIQLGI